MFRYTPHPAHQIIPFTMLVIAAIVAGAFPNWTTGIAFFGILFICVATGLWIAIAGTMEKYTEYWDSIGSDIDKLKNAPPEIWHTFGYIMPQKSVNVKMNMTGLPGESDYYTMKSFNFDITPTELQIFSDAIITKAKTLAEADWKDTQVGIEKVRKLKSSFLSVGLAQLKNPRNKLSGSELTAQGWMYLYQNASSWVKAEHSLQQVVARANPTPSEEITIP